MLHSALFTFLFVLLFTLPLTFFPFTCYPLLLLLTITAALYSFYIFVLLFTFYFKLFPFTCYSLLPLLNITGALYSFYTFCFTFYFTLNFFILLVTVYSPYSLSQVHSTLVTLFSKTLPFHLSQ